MNCIIPAANVKILVRAFQAMAKIGEELYIEAHEEKLLFISINTSKTAYTTFELNSSFFTSYEAKVLEPSTCTQTTIIKCKILIKVMLKIFKVKSVSERKIDYCRIELDPDTDNIIINLQRKKESVSKHKSHLIEMEYLTLPKIHVDGMNETIAPASTYIQMLSNFQLSDDYLTWEVTETKAVIKNFDPNDNNSLRHIRSQIVLNFSEFNTYNIKSNTTVTFSYKPFRAALQFAECFNLPVVVHFGTAGKPAAITIRNPTFESNFVVSTVRHDGSTQSTTIKVRTAQSTQNCKNSNLINTASSEHTSKTNHNMTVQDQEVLEAIDWDNDMEVNNIGTKSDDNPENITVIPDSPESPRAKKIKIIFGRCFEPTFHSAHFNSKEVLAANSDSDCELSDTDERIN